MTVFETLLEMKRRAKDGENSPFLLFKYVAKIMNEIPSKKQIKKSASEYFDTIYPGSGKLYVDSLDMAQKFYPEILFRGQSDESYDIMPGLGRNDNFQYEREFIELSQVERPDVFKSDFKPLELLALLQHYGIPTRLLDVTSNLLVALFFACQENENKSNGELILFIDMHNFTSVYPIMEAQADTYLLTKGSDISLKDFFNYAFEQQYFQSSRYKKLYSDENNRIRCFLQPVVVNPTRHSPRQMAQQGKYLLFPNTIKIDKGSPYLESCISKIEKNSAICKTIIIEAKDKQQLLWELSVLGVDKTRLFPDNLDFYTCELVRNIKSR